MRAKKEAAKAPKSDWLREMREKRYAEAQERLKRPPFVLLDADAPTSKPDAALACKRCGKPGAIPAAGVCEVCLFGEEGGSDGP